MEDTFLINQKCERCGNKLDVRIMSWFNEDIICMNCSRTENQMKVRLRQFGIRDALEGCGYIPNI